MPERPAPQHSAVLNQMVGLPPVHPELEPPPPQHLVVDQRRRRARRLRGAARARARKAEAA